ncbi:D-alanyl-D-alanine carboxypeptidase [Pseudoduganella danionis]|uniref:D-alanyl-D-alanine carboxypeptidase n=1 Tax=Pseudoduganella danionis TaxID=1890295 RepID=UPI00360D2EC4
MLLRRTILAALFTATAVLTRGAMAADLPEAISTLLSTANIPQQAAGIVVMRGNQTLIDHNSSQSMQPASTMKLITTLAALEQLGPAFRARTELGTTADIDHGVLKGDLIVRGGADVDLNEDVLLHLLQALRNQGIRKIKGDVILDRQLFQPARPDLGQPPFDEFPWAYYNVIPDALLTHSNLLRVELRASASELSVVMLPELEQVSVKADLQLVDAPCASWEKTGARRKYAAVATS